MHHRSSARLWSRYLAARDDPAAGPADAEVRWLRDRLVVHYAPLAATVARRTAPKPPPPLDADDVASCGLVALLDAVETYEPGRGARFETYAYSRIRWRVLDEMRKADPLPRSARAKTRAAAAVRASLRQSLGHAPTDEEVAAALGTETSRLRDLARRELAADRPASLDAPMFPSDSTVAGAGPGLHSLLADPKEDPEDDPQAALDRLEARERVAEALGGLDDRSRFVVSAYFFHDMKLREIGAELDLTEGRISQILRAALDALRGAFAPGSPDSRVSRRKAPRRPDAA